jgi:RNA polymerase sigma-70 factor (ECF subfamily)
MIVVAAAMKQADDRAPAHAELDELTLRRAQRGDAAACRELVRHYQRPVFALLTRMLGPAHRRALVEDLAQETFLRVFRKLADFSLDGPAPLSAWIVTIASRLAIDELRRRPVDLVPPEASSGLPGGAAPDEQRQRRDIARAIQRAIADLRPEFRAAFLLREYHGLEYQEIARALDVDLGTVKSRIARARATLRELLAELAHD